MVLRSILKWALFLSIVLALLAGTAYFWHVVRPRMIASRLLEQFETACYTRDLKAVEKLVDPRVYDDMMLREDPAFMLDLFAKFEPGFELLWAESGELETDEEVISLGMAKAAKLDHEKRPFYNIMLINIDGEWKVRQYHFPDLIDY